MSREEAIRMVMDMGDNRDGAEAIVDTMLEQGMALTEESIRRVAEDTWDRQVTWLADMVVFHVKHGGFESHHPY